MTEQAHTGLASTDPTPGLVTATGHPEVDGVIESLHSLSELPVDQHVTVFEAAHTGLRNALSGAAQAAEAPRG